MKFVRYVGNRDLEDASYRNALTDTNVLKFDCDPSRGNVVVRFTAGSQRSPLKVRLAPIHRDLLELAALVYVADEVQARDHGVNDWEREYDVLFPVRTPELWTPLSNDCHDLLHFLSGDHFQVSCIQRAGIFGLGNHRRHLGRGFDCVCLFSGGLDSFVGALRLLEEGNRVLLVGHQADGITSNTQTSLVQHLAQLFPEQCQFVQCRVAISGSLRSRYPLPEKVETNHRVRSFLFLSVAVALAGATRTPRICMPENGLIALNIPLGTARVGTFSTRTAHPRFLSDFSSFAGRLGAFQGDLHNPLLLMNKTEVAEACPPAHRWLLSKTLSCSHLGRVRWTGRKGIQHCGYCVPCIYRRIAMMHVGLDDPADYYRDVFANLHLLTPNEQQDLRYLTSFARSLAAMTGIKLQAQVLRHGHFSPDELRNLTGGQEASYITLSVMAQRWATDFLGKVSTSASPQTKAVLGF